VRRERRIRRAAMLAVALVLLMCCVYIAVESGHDCKGAGCPICAHMHVCMDVLQKLAFAAVAGLAVTAARIIRLQAPEPVYAGNAEATATPVKLKVRQNN